MYRLNKDALSLIKELTEENERLRADCAKGANALIEEIQKNRTIEADTVRKMQEQAVKSFNFGDDIMYSQKLVLGVIDQIAKEMLEGGNNGV
jgi:dynactin complex subunit